MPARRCDGIESPSGGPRYPGPLGAQGREAPRLAPLLEAAVAVEVGLHQDRAHRRIPRVDDVEGESRPDPRPRPALPEVAVVDVEPPEAVPYLQLHHRGLLGAVVGLRLLVLVHDPKQFADGGGLRDADRDEGDPARPLLVVDGRPGAVVEAELAALAEDVVAVVDRQPPEARVGLWLSGGGRGRVSPTRDELMRRGQAGRVLHAVDPSPERQWVGVLGGVYADHGRALA